MKIRNELLKVLDAAAIPYDIDYNAVHTPHGVIYDMSDPFNGFNQRYELEDGGVFTSAESIVKELTFWQD